MHKLARRTAGIVPAVAALTLVGGGLALADPGESTPSAAGATTQQTTANAEARAGYDYHSWHPSEKLCYSTGFKMADSAQIRDFYCSTGLFGWRLNVLYY